MSSVTSNTQVPPKHTGLTRVFKAWGYSLQGLKSVWRTQAAFRQEAIALALALLAVAALPVQINRYELAGLIASGLLVLIVEMLNSAIEACIDRIGPEFHSLSAMAKDIGSAAVLISLAVAVITWGLILYPG